MDNYLVDCDLSRFLLLSSDILHIIIIIIVVYAKYIS